jgi:hypothetical protein
MGELREQGIEGTKPAVVRIAITADVVGLEAEPDFPACDSGIWRRIAGGGGVLPQTLCAKTRRKDGLELRAGKIAVRRGRSR